MINLKNLFLFLAVSLFVFEGYSQKPLQGELYADSLTEAGEYDKAIEVYNKLLKTKPKDQGLLRGKAYAILLKQDWTAAVAEYRKIISLFPKCSKCYLNLAKAYNGKEKSDSALAALDRGIAIEPGNGELYVERARIQMNFSSDSMKILPDLNKGIMLYPEVSDFYVTRARFYFTVNRMNDMLQDLESAIRLDPENYDANFYAFVLLFVAGDNEGAVQALQKCYQLRPEEPAVQAFAQVYRGGMGDTAGREEFLDTLFLSFPKDVPVSLARALYNRVLADFDGYCKKITEAYTRLKTPEDTALFDAFTYGAVLVCSDQYPEYYLNRVAAYRDSTEWDQAITLLTKGQEKFPDNSLIAFNLAWLYYSQRNLEQAFNYIQKAIGNYDRKEFFRASGIQDVNSASAIAVDKSFRFQQLMIMHESLLHLYQKNADNSGYSAMLKTTSDSLMSLVTAVQDPEQRKKFYANAAFAGYLLKDENLIRRSIDESIKNSGASSTPYFFAALAQFEKAAPESFERTGKISDLYAKDHLYFIRLVKKMKKADKVKLEKALSDVNTAITADSAVPYYHYLKGMIRFQLSDNAACDDFNASYKLGLDKTLLSIPAKACK